MQFEEFLNHVKDAMELKVIKHTKKISETILNVAICGGSGSFLLDEAIKQEAVSSGLVIQAADIGAITGKGMDLNFGFAYTSYVIPFLANVKFVLNPAFDNVHTNDIENPIIDGYPLSSYSFIIAWAEEF